MGTPRCECVAAVKALPAISRAGCRAYVYVKARFDLRQIALAYINVYAQAHGRRRPFVEPTLAIPEPAQTAAGDASRDGLDRVLAPFALASGR